MSANNFSFINHSQCEYFPCHKGVREEDFNCLFCYCPLYRVRDCGGNNSILESGVKDCSKCTFPHVRSNYDKIIKRLEVDR